MLLATLASFDIRYILISLPIVPFGNWKDRKVLTHLCSLQCLLTTGASNLNLGLCCHFYCTQIYLKCHVGGNPRCPQRKEQHGSWGFTKWDSWSGCFWVADQVFLWYLKAFHISSNPQTSSTLDGFRKSSCTCVYPFTLPKEEDKNKRRRRKRRGS